MSVVSDDLVNHWSDMPEWRAGRSLWAMYFTFVDDVRLHRAVTAYQRAIDDVVGIDLIDLEWLHLTMQGIAFVDEVQPADVQEISRRLAETVPLTSRSTGFLVHPPIIDHDSIIMPVTPADELTALRDTLLSITEEVLDGRAAYRLPEPVGGFRPHISIAYANGHVPGAAVLGRLARVPPEDVEIRLSHLSFLLLRRARPRWFWNEEHRMSLDEPGHGILVPVPPAGHATVTSDLS